MADDTFNRVNGRGFVFAVRTLCSLTQCRAQELQGANRERFTCVAHIEHPLHRVLYEMYRAFAGRQDRSTRVTVFS